MIREKHIEVARTARYMVRGTGGPSVRQIWFVLHGYGQLASWFIRSFDALDEDTHLVVAPEALSRFYVDPKQARGAPTVRVGASWMTREDRQHEIHDYLRYLDAVADEMLSAVGEDVQVVVLGFSQGVATAARWVALGRVAPHRLILWAGGVPPDLDLVRCREKLSHAGVTVVLGTGDAYVPPAAREREEKRLQASGIPFELRLHDGGHGIDPDLLSDLARSA
jgi:predicted esterase